MPRSVFFVAPDQNRSDSLYWSHNPTTCLAGCTNAATALLPQPAGATECCGEVAALKEANEAKDAEIAAKDAEIATKDAEIAALRAALQ